MKIINALVRLAASEVLCLFINITFAASDSNFMRVICLICTVLIMIFVLSDFSVRSAKEDIKASRVNTGEMIKAGFAVSLALTASYVLLVISVKSGDFDYSRWHKLLNAPFLQFYNLINSNAASSALKGSELAVMLLPIPVPAVSVIVPYYAVCGRSRDR